MIAFRCSKARIASVCARLLFLVRTVLRDASIRSLRFCPTRSDEAREGYGKEITVTRYEDLSVEVEDHGRGIPVDFNNREQRYNWELVFCEMYAGGKYNNASNGSYEYSLGPQRAWACAPHSTLPSIWMWISVREIRATRFILRRVKMSAVCIRNLTKGNPVQKSAGSPIFPFFTDINIPVDYYLDTIKRQAIVNEGIRFLLRNQGKREV